MAAVPTDSDVVVLGDAPAAALAAVRLAASKRRVTWVLPETARGLDAALVRDLSFGPWLSPSIASMPALQRVLEGGGVLDACARKLSPVSPQLLDDRLRATVPAERRPGAAIDPGLSGAHDAVRELTRVAATLGFFRRRSLRKQASGIGAPTLEHAHARTVYDMAGVVLDGVAPETVPPKPAPFQRTNAVRTLQSPHLLDGGGAAWLDLLRERAKALGVDLVRAPLDGLVRSIDPGWSTVRLELAGRPAKTTRLVIDGLDRFSWGRAWAGAPDGLQKKLTKPPVQYNRGALHAWRLLVAKRGLPVPLAPVAVIQAPFPLLLERRPGTGDVDTLVAWTRTATGEDGKALTPTLQARLGAVLPFFEGHVQQLSALTVATHDPVAPWWPGGLPRRILRATGVPEGLDGWEGAAVLAEHLCDVAEGRTPLEAAPARAA